MFDNFEKNIVKNVTKNLTEIVRDLADAIDENTPEDEYELISRNQTEMPHQEGESIKARIFNEDPKAVFVEYGQEPKVMNYYKKSGRRKGGSPFYQGVGARMFNRGLEQMKPIIQEKLGNLMKK